MLDKSIDFTNSQLNYHQKRARSFLRWIWGLAIGIFSVIFLFAIFTHIQLQTVASLFVQSTERIGHIMPNEPVMPDFVQLINENYFGYWAVSGLLLAMMASLGMLKYHSNRTAILEKDLLSLHKLQGLLGDNELKKEVAGKIVHLTVSHNAENDTKISVNPVLDIISENTERILDRLKS